MINGEMDFKSVSGSLGKIAASRESSIMAKINSPEFGSSVADLMALQVETTLWSVTVGANQNIIKDIGDAMKSIIQKG